MYTHSREQARKDKKKDDSYLWLSLRHLIQNLDKSDLRGW